MLERGGDGHRHRRGDRRHLVLGRDVRRRRFARGDDADGRPARRSACRRPLRRRSTGRRDVASRGDTSERSDVLVIHPGAANVIAGRVVATLELRDLVASTVEMLYAAIESRAGEIARDTGTTVQFRPTTYVTPAPTRPRACATPSPRRPAPWVSVPAPAERRGTRRAADDGHLPVGDDLRAECRWSEPLAARDDEGSGMHQRRERPARRREAPRRHRLESRKARLTAPFGSSRHLALVLDYGRTVPPACIAVASFLAGVGSSQFTIALKIMLNSP